MNGRAYAMLVAIPALLVCTPTLGQTATGAWDLDADGVEDQVRILEAEPGNDGSAAFVIEARTAAGRYTSAPYYVVGPVEGGPRVPEELAVHQTLPPGPLAAMDLTGDGQLEIVVYLRLARSTDQVGSLVLSPGGEGQLLELLVHEGGGLLVAQSEEGRLPDLMPWREVYGVPVFGSRYVWDGEAFSRAYPVLPPALVEPIRALYLGGIREIPAGHKSVLVTPFVESGLADDADTLSAFDAATNSLQEVDELIRGLQAERAKLLRAQGIAQAGMEEDYLAVAVLREYAATQPRNGMDAEVRALLTVVPSMLRAGLRAEAMHWLRKAERAGADWDVAQSWRDRVTQATFDHAPKPGE